MEPTSEQLERIADALWNKRGEGIQILDVYQHNACNHTMSGIIDGTGFIVEMGDWSGTKVVAWGDPEDMGIYKPPKPTQWTFVPDDDLLKYKNPTMYDVYLNHWRKASWFTEQEQKLNYDLHFQPGAFVRNYYNAWAKQKGMKIGVLAA